MMRACLAALGVAALFLPATALAQQQLVQPKAPDWYESNRALQVIQAQQRPHPGAGAPGGLSGAEAGQVYRNLIQGIGKPLQPLSGNSSYGPPSGFGGGTGSSSGGQP
ncbi:MAG: hypothetical protein JF625_10260 [Inquilinus limosus]|uniref:DUF3613 domain-containing protein n=1 Tax=Inquilinus limosus TaxID=171674 RepID=A0A952FIX4_9PROT|nr:hypothetical protein [Inquilinus limosus]